MNVLILGGGNLSARIKEVFQEYKVFIAGRNCYDFYFDANDKVYDKRLLELKIDVVIIAFADFGSSNTRDFYDTELVNACGVLNACELASSIGAKHIISISSISSIFSIFSINDPYYNIYSISKKHGDELLAYFCNLKGIDFTILRPSQIYDFDWKCEKHQKMLYHIIKSVILGKDVCIYGNYDPSRNYIHIDDVVNVVYEVVKQRKCGVFNCCSKRNITFKKIFDLTKNICNSSSNFVFDTTKDDMLDLPIIHDKNDIFNLLGYDEKYLIDDNIYNIVKGYKND